MRRSKQTITLPPPLYYTLPELCHRWGCHQDRPFLYMDAGLLVPSALVPKYKLPLVAHEGVAPNICVVLDNYRELVWGHHDGGETIALIAGPFTCVSPVGDGWRTLQLDIAEPVRINRRDLVVLDAERELIEETFATSRPAKPNRAEQKASALVVRALLEGSYSAEEIAHPYKIAAAVCTTLELTGFSLSKETAARKIKEALALKVTTPATAQLLPLAKVG